jgi:hypothetical protein
MLPVYGREAGLAREPHQATLGPRSLSTEYKGDQCAPKKGATAKH